MTGDAAFVILAHYTLDSPREAGRTRHRIRAEGRIRVRGVVVIHATKACAGTPLAVVAIKFCRRWLGSNGNRSRSLDGSWVGHGLRKISGIKDQVGIPLLPPR
jgi:hypothetical protein